MKLIALAILALTIVCNAQTAVQESQKKAIQEFPDLVDANSKLNKRFVVLVNAAKASDPQLLMHDDWPLTLARRAAADVGVAPAAAAAPASSGYVNPLAVTPGRTTISGTIFQRTADGIMVTTKRKGDSGDVWISGADGKEGTHISVTVVRDGVKSFGTVDGAERTIDAYKVVK